MTREEAIEKLELLRQRVDEDTYRALIMAIKALEQPCDDTVSIRKDTLKCRVGNIVAYNVEWLKKHWQMEMDIVCGVKPCEDAISREHLLSEIDKLKKSPWYNDKRGNGFEYLIEEAVDTVVDLCIKQEPSVQPSHNKRCEWGRMTYDNISKDIIFDFSDGTEKRVSRADESVITLSRDEYYRLKALQPSRKGHWISREGEGQVLPFWGKYQCSECGECAENSNFCPNCGAEME